MVNGNLANPATRCLVALSLFALSGCVSAVSEDKEASSDVKPAVMNAEAQRPPEQQISVAGQAAANGYVDPAIVSAARTSASHAASQVPGQASAMLPGQAQAAPQMNGLVTQPTGISANSLSIFANSGGAAPTVDAGASAGSAVPAYAPAAAKIVPSMSSVYSSPTPVPQHDNRPATMPTPQGEQHSANGTMALPQMAAAPSVANPPDAGTKAVPMSAFFADAAARPSTGAVNGLTQVAAAPVSAAARQASGISLAGRTTMSDAFDDTHIDEDDSRPAGLMKLASLSGLSRVAPNGLMLQTEHVNVVCFKPELIHRIKQVESHYGKRAVVTSGYRPPKATTQGSKHYTCDAADIQVEGVTKWELAGYLRSLPDRGGVGTYCHTESVHMDLGEPRDWNWRCRRTAKSL